MKFANNQADLFVENGSEISYFLGLLQVINGMLCQYCNIEELSHQNNIQYCIVYFVALHVIMDIKNLYFESLKTNKLKEVMHNAPKIIIKGKDIKFSKRSCYHKGARILYKGLRSFYASVIYYFVPYSVFFI